MGEVPLYNDYKCFVDTRFATFGVFPVENEL